MKKTLYSISLVLLISCTNENTNVSIHQNDNSETTLESSQSDEDCLDVMIKGKAFYESDQIDSTIFCFKAGVNCIQNDLLNVDDPNFQNRKIIMSQSLKIMNSIISDDSSASNYRLRSAIYCDLDLYEKAIEDCSIAINLDPNNSDYYFARGVGYDQINSTALSKLDYEKAIELDSTNADAQLNLGFIFMRSKDYQNALDCFDMANKYANGSLANKAFSLNNSGFIHYELGEYKKARQFILQSLDHLPKNSYAYRNLALLSLAEDDLDQVCSSIKKALALGFTAQYGNEMIEMEEKYCE